MHFLVVWWPFFLCPAAGLGERVPQPVQRGGWSRAGEAGQEGCAGVVDQRDPANYLRTYSVQSFLWGTMNDRLFRSDNRLYFSSSFSVSHAYFVKHIVSAVLLKIMNTIRTELFTSVCLLQLFCLSESFNMYWLG